MGFLFGLWMGSVSDAQDPTPLILTGPIPKVVNDEEQVEFPINVQADNQLTEILTQIAKCTASISSNSVVLPQSVASESIASESTTSESVEFSSLSEDPDEWRTIFVKLQTLSLTAGDTLVPGDVTLRWATIVSQATGLNMSGSATPLSQAAKSTQFTEAASTSLVESIDRTPDATKVEMTYVPLRRKIRNILLRLPRPAQERFQQRYEVVAAGHLERILDDYRIMKRRVSEPTATIPHPFQNPKSSENAKLSLSQSFDSTPIERRFREIVEIYPLCRTSLCASIMAGELAWQRGDTLAAHRDWSDAIATWEAISSTFADTSETNEQEQESSSQNSSEPRTVPQNTTYSSTIDPSATWRTTDWGQELRVRLMWLSVVEQNHERLARELAAFEVRYPRLSTTDSTTETSISLSVKKLRQILEKVRSANSQNIGNTSGVEDVPEFDVASISQSNSASTASNTEITSPPSSTFHVSPLFSWQGLVHPADPLCMAGQILPISVSSTDIESSHTNASANTSTSPGTIWFADSQSVYAIDRETGEPIWGNETPCVYRDTEIAELFTVWDRQHETQQAQTRRDSDALAQLSLPTTSYHPSEVPPLGQQLQMVTHIRNRLVVRLGSPITRLSPMASSKSPTALPLSAFSQTTQNVLVSLDLSAEGRLDWRTSPPTGTTFDGIPIADEQRVYCVLRRDLSSSHPAESLADPPSTKINAALFSTQSQGIRLDIAAFDVNTGNLLWQRPLLQVASPAQRSEITHTWLMLDSTTSSGSTLFVSTQYGAVAMLDRVTGVPIGIATYPHLPRDISLASISRNLPPSRLHGGVLWTAPQDSDRLFAWEAATGRPIAVSQPLPHMDNLIDIEETQGWGMGQSFYRFMAEGTSAGQVRRLNPTNETLWQTSTRWNFHSVPPIGSGMGQGCRVLHRGSLEIWLPITYATHSSHVTTPTILRYSVRGNFLGVIPLPHDFNSTQVPRIRSSCLLFQESDRQVLAVGTTGIWNISWDSTEE